MEKNTESGYVYIVLCVPLEQEEQALNDVQRWLAEPFCYNGCYCNTGTISDESGGLPSNIFCPNCGVGFTPKAQKEYCDRPSSRQNGELLDR